MRAERFSGFVANALPDVGLVYTSVHRARQPVQVWLTKTGACACAVVPSMEAMEAAKSAHTRVVGTYDARVTLDELRADFFAALAEGGV